MMLTGSDPEALCFQPIFVISVVKLKFAAGSSLAARSTEEGNLAVELLALGATRDEQAAICPPETEEEETGDEET
jgi:hypothetical protein